MGDLRLSCNVYQCNQKLNDEAFVTSCSHMFCEDHGRAMLRNGLAYRNCLICSTKLVDSDYGFVQVHLQPSNNYKSIILNGLNPEQIMDIASRAISFYFYQLRLQNESRETIVKSLKRQNEENCISISSSYKGELLKMQRLVETLQQELDGKMCEIEYQKQKVSSLMRENKHLQVKVESYKREMIFQKAKALSNNDLGSCSQRSDLNMSVNEKMGNPFNSNVKSPFYRH